MSAKKTFGSSGLIKNNKNEEVPIEIVAKKGIEINEEVNTAESLLKPTRIDEPKKEFTLEIKVLNYINAHKNGVKVSDMEIPFNETRMRIGYVTKKLLDDGEVQKTDNLYYPLT